MVTQTIPGSLDFIYPAFVLLAINVYINGNGCLMKFSLGSMRLIKVGRVKRIITTAHQTDDNNRDHLNRKFNWTRSP